MLWNLACWKTELCAAVAVAMTISRIIVQVPHLSQLQLPNLNVEQVPDPPRASVPSSVTWGHFNQSHRRED